MPVPGRFLAVEGLDGSGGTTQVALLAAALRARGLEVLVTGEPTRTLPIGRLIRQALQGVEPFSDGVLPYLFAADRRDHLDREIQPALARGAWVISDRYMASSLAYQALAVGFEHVLELNHRFQHPHLTLMLELDPTTSLGRVASRGEELERFEVLETLERVHASYHRALDWVGEQGAAVAIIDASQGVQGVQADVWAAVESQLLG
jgi:dTMP kinase